MSLIGRLETAEFPELEQSNRRMVAACSRKASSVVDIPLNAQSLDSCIAATVRKLQIQEVKLQHWRGVSTIFCLRSAPVLEFVTR